MAPSKESRALEELFKVFAANFPQDGNNFLGRCIYDQVQQAGSEATGVALEDTTISTNNLQIPCIWFRPAEISSKNQVILFMHGGGFK